MDLIIESFRRLYHSDQINEKTLNTLLAKGTITEADKEYIQKEEGDK